MFSFDDDEDLFPLLDQGLKGYHELILEEDESQALQQECTAAFFQGLMQENDAAQRAAVQRILELLTLSLYDPDRLLIKAQLARVVALSTECPFEYVRHKFSHFLTTNREAIQENVGPIPCAKRLTAVSSFFPTKEFVPEDPVIRKIFQKSFIQNGYVDHVCRALAWHPTYYIKYSETMDFIMDGRDGPLSRDARHYIAIMAASRWKSRYIVEEQQNQFLATKGDPAWLKGILHSPKKYSNLLELNAVMAHTPWAVNEALVLKATTGEDAWTISELVHAFIIMASIRGLALLAAALGLDSAAPEGLSTPEDLQFRASPSTSPILAPTHDVVAKLRQGVKACAAEQTEASSQFEFFQGAEKSDGQPEPQTEERNLNWPMDMELRYQNCYGQILYTEYNVHAGNHLRSAEYNWNTHGYAIVKQYHSAQCANLLAETFEIAYTVTYKRFHNTGDLDTSPFRRAIWYYVHRVHGIFHDDYDYSQVNELLPIKLKQYIKKMCCYPDRIVAKDLELEYTLHPSELGHIALLVSESRKQAEMMYGLRVIAKRGQPELPI